MTPEQMERVGQYVLGLLDGAALAEFERDMAADPALAEAAARLQHHMLSLDDTVDALPANPALWATIEGKLKGVDRAPADNVVALQPRPARRPGWMAMAASVAVALGLGYLAGSFGTGSRQPVMIAVLLNESDTAPGAIIEAFSDDSVQLIPLERFDVPEGRILQVWTLPDPQTGPVSLGTFSDPTAISLSGPDLPQPEAGQLYEITLEPAPGSPTGRPTGPILVKGFAKAPQ